MDKFLYEPFLDPAPFNGINSGLDPAFEIQLLKDVLYMDLYRAFGKIKLNSYVFVAFPFSKEKEYLFFPRRKHLFVLLFLYNEVPEFLHYLSGQVPPYHYLCCRS